MGNRRGEATTLTNIGAVHDSLGQKQKAELYAMVVAPWGDELKVLEQSPAGLDRGQDHVPTLPWSLDGVLRYLPMTALYDGQHYMVERFNNVLFTPESYGHMTASFDRNVAGLRVLAMKGETGQKALLDLATRREFSRHSLRRRRISPLVVLTPPEETHAK